MTIATIFNGKISLSFGNKSKKQLSFSFDTKDLSLNEVVMYNFAKFKFNNFEKRELSREHRKIIYNYQNLCSKKLSEYSKKLIKLIQEQKDKSEIVIQASEVGTFICLCAIYSGELKVNCPISFELYSSPLKLFPKELLHLSKPSKDVEIKLDNKTSSWLSKFQSLSSTNTFLKVKSIVKDEVEYLKIS